MELAAICGLRKLLIPPVIADVWAYVYIAFLDVKSSDARTWSKWLNEAVRESDYHQKALLQGDDRSHDGNIKREMSKAFSGQLLGHLLYETVYKEASDAESAVKKYDTEVENVVHDCLSPALPGELVEKVVSLSMLHDDTYKTLQIWRKCPTNVEDIHPAIRTQPSPPSIETIRRFLSILIFHHHFYTKHDQQDRLE